MNNKLTKLERYWILYDVGNSAFVLLVATILPIYFNHLADTAGLSEVDYLAYWGYAASVATVVVALLGPVLGSIADMQNYKKPLFTACMMVGVIGCAALSVPTSWIVFLAVYVIAKVGFNASLIFYDSMLTDVTTEERFDMVSSSGYAWGYIGSCIPFVISLAFVLLYNSIGISFRMAMTIAFFLNAAWWLIVTLPLLKNYKQTHFVSDTESGTAPEHPDLRDSRIAFGSSARANSTKALDSQADNISRSAKSTPSVQPQAKKSSASLIRSSFSRLGHTFVEISHQKNIFYYLLAFFFFIDGVYTIIDMATAYGSALGLDTTGLLLALLVTQIVAFPFALIFGRLSRQFQTDQLIRFCIGAYTLIALFAIQLDKQWEFWLLAVCVGMFQGAIQALSRSYFAKIIPPEKSGEYFGIYDIFGKGASFMGTFLVGVIAQITGSTNAGVSVLAVMFVIGFLLFGKAAKLNRPQNSGSAAR
ncbi:MAG: MFS transporter [Clostridiales bacterium]|nr:MFS transporter [Clostridiales bacterium]